MIGGRFRWAGSVHTVKLQPIIKAQISEKLVTNGISDVVITLVHSEKTRLKKMITIIIITPHAQRERGKVICRGVHIYIYLLHTSPAHCTFFNDA